MQTNDLYQIKIYRNQPPAAPAAWPDWLQPKQTAPVQQFHQTLPQYQPTPLLSLTWRQPEACSRCWLRMKPNALA